MCCSVLCSKKGKKPGDYMWDAGPQSIEAQKPQNPGYFLLQISLNSLGSSLLLHIHIAAVHTCMTQSVQEVCTFISVCF